MLGTHGRGAVIALALAALTVTGCGSSSSSKTTSTSTSSSGTPAKSAGKIDASTKVKLQTGLLGNQDSAGDSDSYQPTGKIVADNGFRPSQDGFGFENYGNDAGPVNMTAENVENIFGKGVCAPGTTGKKCALIPAAQQWMDQENASMDGGHCMGFSVTALRMFVGNLTASAFGAKRTVDIPVQGNRPLQSEIAEGFSYQSLPSVTDHEVTGSPSKVLDALIKALNDKSEGYTLGIFKADGTGGHAITPFAVEDKGSGKNEILVYDNNFPGVIRKVDVDTSANTWHYVGGINPSDTDEVYDGDEHTKNMLLLPTSPGVGKQPCPFCPSKPGQNPKGSDYLLPDNKKYLEIGLLGIPEDHPHLVFQDAEGRNTGYVNGKFVQDIPGIKVVQNFSVQNWSDSIEPRYRLPLNHPKYVMFVDGSDLKKAGKFDIGINGAGIAFYVRNIKMDPGQKDALRLPPKNVGVTYASGLKSFPTSPEIVAQFFQFDRTKKLKNGFPVPRMITLDAGWVGYAVGSPVSLTLKTDSGTAILDSSEGQDPAPEGSHWVLSVDSDRVPGINEGAGDQSYITDKLDLDPSKGQKARFHYLRIGGDSLPVDVLNNDGSKASTLVIPRKK